MATGPTAQAGTASTSPDLEDLDALRGGEGLEDYVRRVSPRYPSPAHVAPIVRLVERALSEGNVRAVVSMPPRHAKTWTFLHGLAWTISRSPSDRCAYCSYGDELSDLGSRTVRRLVTEGGVPLAEDMANLSNWRTWADGGLVSTSIGGGFTGKGVTGLLVIDDPIKNDKEAKSLLVREAVWDWFNNVAYTRLEKGASCIVVATRWHPDDLIGRLEASGEWGVVNLPAFDEATGEALWPEQFPADALAKICAQIGEHNFSALYQGRPRARGAHVFGMPGRYEPSSFSSEGKRILIGVDPAASERTNADWSVAVVMAAEGYGPAMRAWILDVVRMQTTVPTFVQKLRDMQARWRAPLAVESVGGFKAIPQMLRQMGSVVPTPGQISNMQVSEIRPLGDKFTRAQPVASAWNDGRVLVPIGAPWADAFLSECEAFTGVRDLHDDQVDALAHAWNSLAQAPRPRAREVLSTHPFG